MQVAITGSTGFLGEALVRRLSADGHEVIRVRRPATKGSAGPGIAWDPDEGSIDASGFEGIDAVVHLAGVGIGDRRWTSARKRLLRESRVGSGSLLATALAGLSRPPRALVSGSAIGYYGDRGTQILDEDSGPGRGFLADLCVEWEAATRPAEDAGIRVAHLRTGIVLGKGGALFKRLIPAFRFGVGGRLGDGTQYQSWISLEDHAAAVAWVIAGDLAGAVNVTAPEPVTNLELTRAIGRALRRPSVMVVPRSAMALVLGRELVDDLLSSQRVAPARLSASGFTFAHPTIDAALASIFG